MRVPHESEEQMAFVQWLTFKGLDFFAVKNEQTMSKKSPQMAAIQEERVAKLVSEIALLQKEGAVQDSIVDVNYNTARKIQKEVENFYYDMITKRMSAEAAKEQAAAMIDKIAKDYELGKGHLDNENQKNTDGIKKKQSLHIKHITDKIYHYQDTTKQLYLS